MAKKKKKGAVHSQSNLPVRLTLQQVSFPELNIIYTHSTDSVFPNNFIICLTA